MALLTFGAAFGADVDGKWVTSVPLRTSAVPVTYEFKVYGEKLTGKVYSDMGDIEIKEGAVKGDELTFVVPFERDGHELRLKHKATISGNEMRITLTPEGREDRALQFVAKRAT